MADTGFEAPPAGAPGEDIPGPDVLAVLGADIGEPDPDAADSVRAAIGTSEAAAALGRLGELACWWASVRGASRPGRPGRVLLAGGSAEVAARRAGVEVAESHAGGPDIGAALMRGVTLANDAADRGVDLVVLCLDDPVAARTLCADLLGLDAVEASGWPTDRAIPDRQWMDEVAVLRDRLRRVRGLRDRPADLLRRLDAPATATAVGLLVQASARRIPTLLDGPGAAAAALLARRTCYPANAWWQAAHRTTDPVHERALASLGLRSLTDLGITLEDGTAALAGLAILDAAAAVLDTLPEPPAVTDEIDPL